MRNSLLFLTLLALPLGSLMAQDKRPNIVLILADDLGYSDLGSYGSEIPTPNLDRLAQEGIRFREFYNNSICAPTRASLLTGQYQHRAGVGYFSFDLGLPAYQGFINQESLTLAEVLKESGYRTLTAGKWHVSKTGTSTPEQRGFEYVWPTSNRDANSGAPTFGTPRTDAAGYPVPADLQTNQITNNALTFIEETAGKGKPFFLYLAHTAPHWPLVALPQDIERFKGAYSQGWEVLRQERLKRQLLLGIRSEQQTIAPAAADIYEWDRLSFDEQQAWSRKMEVYAAMVYRLDQGVGELYQKLAEKGELENTVIFFLSDNGAPAEDLQNWHRGASKNSHTVGTTGSYESQSKNWSYLSNTPFRAFKDDMYEGGINTPFIAWYPKSIPSNRIKQGTGHIIDLAPTIYELAKAPYPTSFAGVQPHALPGKSLLPVLFSNTEQVARSEPLFWERAGNRAVRQGSWKLVSTWPSRDWELYNLSLDPGETDNIAKEQPAVVTQLTAAYYQWAEKNGVVDFALLEQVEPKSMQEFRRSKTQDVSNRKKL
ncbi:arylsulfatase [Sphingobacteriaceae bacterium WQ 2009]|uniref:Arylsulfatase n=1 Tax=Rhinopithecimicrobium faecis TaxID=2820698 RepID=A0A8T4H6J9_9SPHI|nr:arylsulfatase [Sphingobacteriaceae bacterium WQ 2009]